MCSAPKKVLAKKLALFTKVKYKKTDFFILQSTYSKSLVLNPESSVNWSE
jgi:hypothetical protein